MGFTPRDVGAMSLWQFAACVDGYIAANSPDKRRSMTGDEEDEAVRLLNTGDRLMV